MATSGSTDYSVTRNDIINAALRRIGRLDPNVTPNSEDVDTCAEYLNELLKSWNNSFMGRQLFTTKRGFLFMESAKTEYLLGPSGDNATSSYTEVAAQSVVAATKIVLPNSAWAAGQQLGAINVDSATQWFNIEAVSNSTTCSVSPSISTTISTSAVVFVYTDKLERPVDILHMRLRRHEGDDEEISHMSKERYNNIYKKTQTGEPTKYHYEPLLTNGKCYFNYLPTDFQDVVSFDYRRPFEDFDAAADNPDLPQELIRALKWGLAGEIGVEYGIADKRQKKIDEKAAISLAEIKSLYSVSPRRSEPAYDRKARVR